MSTTSYIKTSLFTLLIGCLTAVVAACSVATQHSGEVSRVRLYDSVRAMASDSSLVVIGTVIARQETKDIDDITVFTLASVKVDEVLKDDRGIKSGGIIVIRQFGSEGNDFAPVPLLAQDQQYLLYLSDSGLGGDLADQYYVTGSNAGIYQERDGRFFQVQGQDGEKLPEWISLDEALG